MCNTKGLTEGDNPPTPTNMHTEIQLEYKITHISMQNTQIIIYTGTHTLNPCT